MLFGITSDKTWIWNQPLPAEDLHAPPVWPVSKSGSFLLSGYKLAVPEGTLPAELGKLCRILPDSGDPLGTGCPGNLIHV